jgi:hypothetical protein
MTDAQILTIALATVPTMITVLIGILINNSRISDLNARMGDFRTSSDGPIRRIALVYGPAL